MIGSEKNGTSAELYTAELARLATAVHALSATVGRMRQWDDRLGSAIRRLWSQTLTVLLLIGIIGMLVFDRLAVKPEILPYLYIVDMQGEVLWKGVPGSYEIRDVFVMNHLEDWIKDTRPRPDDPTLVTLWKHWTRANQMIVEGSECHAQFQAYMRDTDPRQRAYQPRIEVELESKKPLSRSETGGEYRLAWREIEYGRSGQVLRHARWEVDMTVVLDVPKTWEAAQQTNRYGILLSRCSWSEKTPTGGL